MSGLFSITSKGDFKELEKFLKKGSKANMAKSLSKMGDKIVKALKAKTPVRTGRTASSWFYKISNEGGSPTLEICNSNVNGSVNIAIILHYGHGTGTGGYVPGRPYIKGAIDSVYKSEIDNILKDILK